MLEKWMKTFPSPTRGIYNRSTVETAALTTPGCPRSFMRFRTSRVEIAELKEDSWWKIHNTNHPASMKSIAKKLKFFSTKIKNLNCKKQLYGDFHYSKLIAIQSHILVPLPGRDLHFFPHSFTACLKFQACHPADQSFLIRTYSRWPQLLRSAQGNPSTQRNFNLKGPPYP